MVDNLPQVVAGTDCTVPTSVGRSLNVNVIVL